VIKTGRRIKNEIVSDRHEAESEVDKYTSEGTLMAACGDSVDDIRYLIKTPDGKLRMISSQAVKWEITVDEVTMDEAEDEWWDVVYTEEAKEKLEHEREYIPSKAFMISPLHFAMYSVIEKPKSKIVQRRKREKRESDIVPKLANKYMKQGYSRSEAFKRAWEEYRKTE